MNELCIGKSRAKTHNKTHCYWPGGGLEDKAPAWVKGKAKEGETVAAALPSPAQPSPSFHLQTFHPTIKSCPAPLFKMIPLLVPFAPLPHLTLSLPFLTWVPPHI